MSKKEKTKNKYHILVKPAKTKKGQTKHNYLLCKKNKFGESCKKISKKDADFWIITGIVEVAN